MSGRCLHAGQRDALFDKPDVHPRDLDDDDDENPDEEDEVLDEDDEADALSRIGITGRPDYDPAEFEE